MGTLGNSERTIVRTSRLGFRVTWQQQVLLHGAATALNKSVNDFVLDSACAAAEDALLSQRLFLLEEKDFQKFQEALDRPAKVNVGLQNLMQERAPWQ